MSTRWSDSFTRSRRSPAVFFVRNHDAANQFVGWLQQTGTPESRREGLFQCWSRGWAFGDGGLTLFDPYGFPEMPAGFRVIGWESAAIAATFLDIRVPPSVSSHQGAADATAFTPSEVADMLAGCRSGDDLVWTAFRLLGDTALPTRPQPTDPAPGDWGRAGVAAGSHPGLSALASLAEVISARERLQIAPGRLDFMDARRLTEYLSVAESEWQVWQDHGVPRWIAVDARDGGMTPSQTLSWLKDGRLGVHIAPWAEALGQSGALPADLAPYNAAGAPLRVAADLFNAGVNADAFAHALADSDRSPVDVARALPSPGAGAGVGGA